MTNSLPRVVAFLALLAFPALSAFAQTPPPSADPSSAPMAIPAPAGKQIPPPLQPWVDWATWDDAHRLCPTPFNEAKKHLCFWPSRLELSVEKAGGKFALQVTVFHETWVPLPGSGDAWPQGLTVNGAAAPVVERAGQPSVRLAAGTHRLEGTFRWSDYPQRLALPKEIGLIALNVEGAPVEAPSWDADGALWLRRDNSTEETAKDSLQLKAHALLEDGIPVWLRMHVELTVSGKSREEELGTILPEGWKMAAVESELPVAVDAAGKLKAQVRAGTWKIHVGAFRTDKPKEVRFAQGVTPIAQEILVALVAQPSLRVVELTGVQAVDVSQVVFPDEWRSFPVHRWNTGEPLIIEERMRGMGEQKVAGLTINRQLWLDENRREFTFRDSISGQMQQIWRLDSVPGQVLGAVRKNGEGELITLNPQNGATGVEIRTREINLEATGEIERTKGLPATGWQADAEKLQVTLNLPPGWRLFALFGADWVQGDWLTSWTLLDLFLLLIFTLAIYRLWGVVPAVLAFLAFGLSYHEPGSPRFIWLLLIIPLALLRVVAGGWGRRILVGTKWLVLAGFVFILVPFLAGQIQQALYPQLEAVRSYTSGSPVRASRMPAAPASEMVVDAKSGDFETSGGSFQVQAKLERITLPKLDLREATVQEAVRYLESESAARDTSESDPARRGVRIELQPGLERSVSAPVIPGLDPSPGTPSDAQPGEARITVSLANIPLSEALRYVTGLANLKFKVERGRVLVVSQGTPTETLITKEWVTEPNQFFATSSGSTSSRGRGQSESGVKEYLQESGVTFPAGSSVVYLPGSSKLIMRNTQDNLDLTDAILGSSFYAGLPGMGYDPAAKIQTGPAIPEWSWRTVSFGWNGPVQASQQVKPWLIPAWLERILSLLRVALILVLAALLLNARGWGASLFRARRITATVAMLALLLLPAGAFGQGGEIPNESTLEKLRERLLKPADAFPRAAEIPSASLKLEERRLTIEAEIHTAAQTAVPLPGRLPEWLPVTVLVNDKPAAVVRREDGNLWVMLPPGVHRVRVEGMLAKITEWQWTFLLKPRQVTVTAPGWTVTGVRPDGIPEQQVFLVRQQEAPAAGDVAYDRPDVQPLILVKRSIHLGLLWDVHTQVTRRSPLGKAAALRVPLIPGENVLSSDMVVKDGFVEVRLGAQQMQVGWTSRIPFTDQLTLATRVEDTWVEQWDLVVSPVWNLAYAGLPPIFSPDSGGLAPEWHPWPGEKVDLTLSRPQAVAGATVTVNRAQHTITLGKRQRVSKLELALRCSVGQDFLIDLPASAQITALSRNGSSIPVRKDGAKVIVPLSPGEQSVVMEWKTDTELGVNARAEEVKLPVDSANVDTTIQVPEDRWVLWTSGPQRGPAVRFWVILICSLLAAAALGRLVASPLRVLEWVLLVIGLTQVPLPLALVVIGWLFLLAWRGHESFQRLGNREYNLAQVVLMGITAAALGILIFAVGEGLLGSPEMFIRGNDSYRTLLRWYESRSDTTLTTPACISVSIWWYRFLMLAWALWLAAALLRWLKMAWQNFSRGGVFRPFRKPVPPPPLPTAAQS